MELKVVNFANRNCHIYGSQVLDRAVKFVEQYDVDADPEMLWHTITNSFVVQNPDMLVLAAVEGEEVYGHLLVRIVNNDGMLIALITQLAIDRDKRDGRETTIEQGLEVIHGFALSKGATRVRCWAMNEELAILFKRLGFEPKDYVLMDIALEVKDG
jgi:hypothetical protein